MATKKSGKAGAAGEGAKRGRKGEGVKVGANGARSLHVNAYLYDDEIDIFLAFKTAEHLRSTSEAGRKLILGRLAELNRGKARRKPRA